MGENQVQQPAAPVQQGPGGADQVQQMAVQIIKAILEGRVSIQDIMNDPNIPTTVKKIVMAYIQTHKEQVQQIMAQKQQAMQQGMAQQPVQQ